MCFYADKGSHHKQPRSSRTSVRKELDGLKHTDKDAVIVVTEREMRESRGFQSKGEVKWKKWMIIDVQTGRVSMTMTVKGWWMEHVAANPLRLIMQLCGDQQLISMMLSLFLLYPPASIFIMSVSEDDVNCRIPKRSSWNAHFGTHEVVPGLFVGVSTFALFASAFSKALKAVQTD